jgi:hypothetical protein
MSTVDSSNRIGRHLVDVIRVLVTALLGGIGAAAGFSHTHDWAVHHGQTGWLAWADAVVIEGMAIVAGFEVHRDHHRPSLRGRRVSFPLVVLVAGFGIQMAAQVALAEPTPAGWLLAAMPALGFLVVVKLLMRRAPTTDPATPAPVADRPTPEVPAPRQTAPPLAASEPAPAPAPPAPAPVPAAAGAASRLKLPPEMTTRITAVVDEVRRDGREVTADDIRRAVKVPDAMAAQILADLRIHNGHTLTP